MNIPNFVSVRIVDENGRLTNEFNQIFGQLIGQLQGNLSDNGYKIPSLPTSEINKMNSINYKNILVIDDNTNELKINLNGTFKVVQTV